jgi:phage minor structural protein
MIHITDAKTDVIQAVITEENVLEDVHRQSLEDTLETFDFTVFGVEDFIPLLEKRNRVIIPDEDFGYREFIIEETIKYRDGDEIFVEVYSVASYLELKKARVIEPQVLREYNVSAATAFALRDSEWRVGVIEKDNYRTFRIETYRNPYAFLKTIASTFDLELRFRVETDGKKVTDRFVDLVEQVGEWRGREIEFGSDLLGIERIENTEDIVTALHGIGPEREDGSRIEVVVEDEDALQRWGREDKVTGNLRHLIETYEPTSERSEMTEEELRQYTRTALNNRINEIVTYTADIADLEHVPGLSNKKIRFGDTLKIKDTAFNPPLYLEARVFEQERSIFGQEEKRIKLGDFTEYTEEEVQSIWQSLQNQIRAKISWEDATQAIYLKEEVDAKTEPGIEAKEKLDRDVGEAVVESTTGAQDKADSSAEAAKNEAIEHTDGIAELLDGRINDVQVSADSKNTIYRGEVEPSLAHVDDLWYKPTENGETEMYQYVEREDGSTGWENVFNTEEVSNLEDEVSNAREYTDEEVAAVRSALQGELSDQIGDVNAEISGLEDVQSDLTGRVSAAEGLLDSHDGKFSDYDVKFNEIDGELTAHFEEMERLEDGIQANSTEIETTAEGINATIDDFRAEYDDDKTDILSSISSNESEITAMADEISARVTRDEFENLEIGGNNLASLDSLGTWETPWIRDGYVFQLRPSEIGRSGIRIDSSIFEEGKHYVLSYKMKKISGEITSIGGHNDIGRHTKGLFIDGENVSSRYRADYPNDDKTHEIEYYFEVVDLSASDPDLYIQPNRGYYVYEYEADIWDVQVEEGNKKTKWNPSYKDTQSQIDSAVSRITSTEATLDIHADAIEARVHQDELENYVDKQVYNDRMSELTVDIDGISSDVSSLQTEVDNATDEITSVQSFASSIDQKADQISSNVTSLSDDLDTTNRNVSNIDQKADSIQSTVSAIETDVSGLESDMSAVQTDISQMPDQISLAVSEGIEGIDVGGRNLLNSDTLSGWSSGYDRQGDVFYLEGTNAGIRILPATFEKFTDYVMSFKIRKTSGTIKNIAGHATGFVTNKVLIDGEETGDSWSGGGNNPYPDDEETHTVEVYIRWNDSDQTGLYIQPNRASYNDDYTAEIWDLQLEKGNKRTDWTPAPEDQVNKTNVLSSINLSTEGVRIAGDKLELDGDVNVTGSFKVGDANIDSLSADKLTVGSTLDAQEVRIINMDASNIVTGELDALDVTIKNLTANDVNFTGHVFGGDATFEGRVRGGSIEQFGDEGSITIDNNGFRFETEDGSIEMDTNEVVGTAASSSASLIFEASGNYGRMEILQDQANSVINSDSTMTIRAGLLNLYSSSTTYISGDLSMNNGDLTVGNGDISSGSQITSTRSSISGGFSAAHNEEAATQDRIHVLTAHNTRGYMVVYPQRYTGEDVFRIRSHHEKGDYRNDFRIDENRYIRAPGIYYSTTTNSANLRVGTSAGRITRNTSLRKYKLDVESAKNPYRILNLDARTWFDKGDVERFAEELDKKAIGEDYDFEDVEHIKRIGGLIAEEVVEAGLETYAEYDEDGELVGVAYDRIWTLLIPIVRDHQREIEDLRTENQLLWNEIQIIKERISNETTG